MKDYKHNDYYRKIPNNNFFEKESEESDLEKILQEIKQIADIYPHPLEGTTKFKTINSNIISINFFPKSLEKGYVEKSDIVEKEEKILNDIERLKNIKDNLIENNKIDKNEQRIYIYKITEYIIGLFLLKEAIWIEGEKGGCFISEKEKEFRHKKINFFSTILYGPTINESPYEIEKIKQQISKIYSSYGDNLSKEEQKEFKKFFYFLFEEKIENIQNKESKKQSEWKEEKISSEDLKELFEKVMKIIGIKKNIELSEEKNFIDIGENGNFIPKGKQYTKERALKLLSHEIETHLVRMENHELKLKTSGNIIQEEGLAILNERLTEGNIKNISKQVSDGFINIFASENLDYKNLYRFLYLFRKMKNQDISYNTIHQLIIRKKRYHPFDNKGAGRKDAVYYRGFDYLLNHFLKKDIEQSTKDFNFLLKGKIKLEDKKKLQDILNQKGRIQPLWIGKILYKKLEGKKIYFSELKEEDFRFKNIGDITLSTKKEIVNILKWFK